MNDLSKAEKLAAARKKVRIDDAKYSISILLLVIFYVLAISVERISEPTKE